MFKSILASLPPLNLKVNKTAIFIYAFSIIIMLLIGAQRSNIPAYYFTRDVAVLNGGKFYYGAISTIGMFLWCASAAIGIFTSIILRRLQMKNQAKFLQFAGMISLFLMIDDQFMLHETVFPTYFGIHEYAVLALYPILIFTYLVLFYKEILASQFLILISALSLLGLSMVCAQYGHLILKVSYYSRGCKSLTGE
uniref:hypothetical protein n=1 Tax=uncultured Pontibacter sp. TaxID=453356 RepID=UPI00260951D4